MTTVIQAGRRFLPRGYLDFLRQCVIWFGFIILYQLARGLADRDPTKAFANGLRVLDLEQKATHHVFELTVQHIADQSHLLLTAAAWTYWNSEFTVIGLALLWVYLRRNEHFKRLRNTILLANALGLIGYVLLPTAPPRMFPSFGFTDALDSISGLNHGSGFVQLAANPYAAFPSLHAADSLIVGICLAAIVRRRIWKVLWLVWPVWVWFCVMATANHYWLDVLAGIAVALVSLRIVARLSARRREREVEGAPIANLL
jgi:membrane-associated phospholipid phosphatase